MNLVRLVTTVLAGAAVAGLATAQALAGTAWRAQPAFAQRLWPGQPQALVRIGEIAFAKGPADPRHLAIAERSARAALRAQAAHGKALQLLGLVANARGEQAQAARLMTLSSRLSRRNGFVQLWFVDNDARAGRTVEALSHFDIAMTASPALSGKLFPVLANALRDPGIRRAFRGYVVERPKWLAPFLGYAVDQNDNPAAIATTIVEAGGLPRRADYDPTVSLLLDKLALKGRFAEMLALYRTQAPEVAARISTSLAFDSRGIDPTFAPIAWQLPASDSAQVSLVPGEGGREPALRFEAYDAAEVLVARKYLFLRPGRYRLAQGLTALSEPGTGRLRMALTCPSPAPLRLLDTELGGTAPAAPTITVPSGCPAQLAILTIVGAVGSDPFEAVLTRLELVAG